MPGTRLVLGPAEGRTRVPGMTAWVLGNAMSELALTIMPETAADAVAIERLHERTFGPGRFARTAFRIREGKGHVLELSFTARIGTLMVGSVRLTPICIGDTPALLLGPLTVEPPFRSHGVGTALVKRALAEAKVNGHKLVVLVGDEPIYAKSGFKRIPKGQVKMPGPVDPARLLIAELASGAFDGVSGMIRPDWDLSK
jgi:predicted N-acetyltransferase YhbS